MPLITRHNLVCGSILIESAIGPNNMSKRTQKVISTLIFVQAEYMALEYDENELKTCGRCTNDGGMRCDKTTHPKTKVDSLLYEVISISQSVRQQSWRDCAKANQAASSQSSLSAGPRVNAPQETCWSSIGARDCCGSKEKGPDCFLYPGGQAFHGAS